MQVKNVSNFESLPLPKLKFALSAYKDKISQLFIDEETKKGRGVMMITLQAEKNTVDMSFLPLEMIKKKEIQDAVVKLNKKSMLFIAKEDEKVVTFSLPR